MVETTEAWLNVSTGEATTCGVSTSHSVWCWGSDKSVFDNPVYVPTLLDSQIPWQTVSVGYDHICALAVDGEVNCKGDNGWGQLGLNIGWQQAHWPKVENSVIGAAIGVASGYSFTCAFDANSLWCWGRITHSQTPIKILDITDITNLTAGGGHACYITSNGD